MATVDKDYIDAKFESVKQLLEAHNDNLKGYIAGVSANAKKAQDDLQAHKDSPDAHGAAVAARGKGEWLSLGAIFISLGALAVDLIRGKH